MKAVVVELKDMQAAVLDESGCIRVVKNRDFYVSQVIHINTARSLVNHKESIIQKPLFKFAVACLVVMLLSFGSITAYAMPISTVTVDVNPSIAIQLNLFGKVVRILAENEDGESIVSEIEDTAKGSSIDEAVSLAMDALAAKGYIDQQDTPVILSVNSSFSDEEELQYEVLESLNLWNMSQELSQEAFRVQAEVIIVSDELEQEAKEGRVSPGKLYLVQQLEEALRETNTNTEFHMDDWVNKTIDEIKQAEYEYRNRQEFQYEQNQENSSKMQGDDMIHSDQEQFETDNQMIQEQGQNEWNMEEGSKTTWEEQESKEWNSQKNQNEEGTNRGYGPRDETDDINSPATERDNGMEGTNRNP